jgi:hypothetical protein
VRITSTFQADDGHEYEILSDTLGAGAQGAVRRGRRGADDRSVAIKRITGGARRGPEANRELQIALKLHQQDPQHLLVPLSWAIDDADLLLVMPLADHSLAAELARNQNGLAQDALLPVLRDITSGLVELHAVGIVHRDLKPDNVLLYDGRWCVADFGISRDLDVRTATVTFHGAGTVPYVAPERWRAQPATHKSDLYALGCIAYELVTGHTVFTGDQDTQRHHHLHTPPPATSVGPTLARWVSRLLDKDPARRPQEPAAALAALPQAPGPPGRLAAEAWRAQQARSQHAATQGQAVTAAEAAAAERRQALADLVDLCASVDEQARRDVPDLRWDNHGDIQRFSVDDVRLEFILWRTIQDRDGLILVGEVSTVVRGVRRCAANIVCERSGARLQWFLDAVTRNAFAGIAEAPGGFAEEADLFTHYDYIQLGGLHAWERQRQALTIDAALDLLGDLLEAS